MRSWSGSIRKSRGGTAEAHAGVVYADPLRAPLAARGATLTTPLVHLRQGEQLAWYHPAGSRWGPSLSTSTKTGTTRKAIPGTCG